MREKPIVKRFLRVCGLGVIPLALARPPQPAGASAPLREEQALARALGREALEDLVAGGVGVAEAAVVATRRWDNPVFSYTFEQAKGGGGGADEGILFLQQQIEPKRRRRLRTRAAEVRVSGAKDRAAQLRIEVEARVRGVFYELLSAARREAAAGDWATRLARVAEVVELRHRAGDVSGYDRKRVDRERATVRATRAAAAAARLAAAEELAGFLGDPVETRAEAPGVEGELLPADPPAFLGELLRRVEDRPDIRALRAEARAAGLDERVARGWKVPAFTLGAGFKDVRDGAADLDGPVAYAAVPLPILNRQEGPRDAARARRRRAEGGVAIATQEARGRVRGIYAKERKLVAVAGRFRAEALDPADELLRTAEAAYRSGEVGILSLLDAYRSAYEARAQFLDLALAARRARIELDRATGGLPR